MPFLGRAAIIEAPSSPGDRPLTQTCPTCGREHEAENCPDCAEAAAAPDGAFEPCVLTSSRPHKLLFVVLAGASVALCLAMALDPPPDLPVKPSVLWAGAVFFSVILGYFIHLLRTGLPRLRLDETGVVYEHPFVGKSWRWTEVVRFELDRGVMSHLFMRIRQIRVLTRRTASLESPEGFQGPLSDREKIPLQYFAEGRKRRYAQLLVEELERWRRKFG